MQLFNIMANAIISFRYEVASVAIIIPPPPFKKEGTLTSLKSHHPSMWYKNAGCLRGFPPFGKGGAGGI
jgi:hypothetical protein